MEPDEKRKSSPSDQKPSRPLPLPRPQSAAFKEQAWGDRTEEEKTEPYEETYRDGSMKNECW